MTNPGVTIRPLEGSDLAEADRIMALLDRGYRAQLVGVTMHKPDESAYHDESALGHRRLALIVGKESTAT